MPQWQITSIVRLFQQPLISWRSKRFLKKKWMQKHKWLPHFNFWTKQDPKASVSNIREICFLRMFRNYTVYGSFSFFNYREKINHLTLDLLNKCHTYLTKNLCFTEFSTKIHWNTKLAASDVFHMFTQSIKFF